WHLAKKAVYGISELHKEEIRKTDLVANPGCFSSAAILGLAPLFKEDMVDINMVIVDGLSGTAGVGAELSKAAHHPEIGNNLVPYNVVNHRHTYEMEQELGILAKKKVSVHFTPVYVPIVRGILDICHVFPEKIFKKDDLIGMTILSRSMIFPKKKMHHGSTSLIHGSIRWQEPIIVTSDSMWMKRGTESLFLVF
ncbi:MAG: hypothetical protein JRG81_17605, partial [Deltaproteobacteria bacterium]|nr:hypothetical protein [Deltaproteobacteria bacterium]